MCSTVRRRTYRPPVAILADTTGDTLDSGLRGCHGERVSSVSVPLCTITHLATLCIHESRLGFSSLSVAQTLIYSADNFADQFVDQKISISDYSLSASVACGKFCCAMEEIWDIV